MLLCAKKRRRNGDVISKKNSNFQKVCNEIVPGAEKLLNSRENRIQERVQPVCNASCF